MQNFTEAITKIDLDQVSDLMEAAEIISSVEAEGMTAHHIKHPKHGNIKVITSACSSDCFVVV